VGCLPVTAILRPYLLHTIHVVPQSAPHAQRGHQGRPRRRRHHQPRRARRGVGAHLAKAGQRLSSPKSTTPAKQAIIETLLTAYPTTASWPKSRAAKHGAKDSDHVWIIDPLDGTTNFIHGFPVYCVSIALAVKGKVEQAVIYDPSATTCSPPPRAAAPT
jgi:hypothetical protein